MATADTYIRCARPYAKTPVHAHHNVYLTQWVQTRNEEYVHACWMKSYNYIYNPTCTKVKKCPGYLHANWHLATRVFLHPPRAKQWLNDWCDPGKTHEHRVRFGLHLQVVMINHPGTRKMVACDHLHVHTTDRAGERLTSSVTFLNSR